MTYENEDGVVIASGGDLAGFGLVVNEFDVRQAAAAAFRPIKTVKTA